MQTKLLGVLFVFATATFAAEKPNFVFMIADDCTYRDIGCYGGQAYTPHIGALAQQYVRRGRAVIHNIFSPIAALTQVPHG